MHLQALGSALLLFAACCSAKAASPVEARREKIKTIEAAASSAAQERKARSDARLRAEGVPVNRSLPPIEDAGKVRRRSKEEIAWRAMALIVIAVKGEGIEQSAIDRLIKDYKLDGHFTPKERAFLRQRSPSEHDRAQFVWRYEAAWTLLWALGYVEKLEKPTAICDVPRTVKFLHDRTAEKFIADARLRPIESIVDEADLIYRYHWATVDAASTTSRGLPRSNPTSPWSATTPSTG
jgi:hypothetical protein